MRWGPKELLDIVKRAHYRVKGHPNYDVFLLLQHVECALQEEFNSDDANPTGIKYLDLLLLESTFHELRPALIQALFESTEQTAALMQNRELARNHWESHLGMKLR